MVGRGAATGQVELVERCDPTSRRELGAEEAVALLRAKLPEQRHGLGVGA